MKPRYFDVPLDFEPWTDSKQPVFREKTATPFSATNIKQNSLAEDSQRQRHFETQLRRISEAMSGGLIPVFSRWNDGVRRRLDLGCVGHSLARQFIEPPEDDRFLGYVTHIKLKSAEQNHGFEGSVG